MRGIAILRLVAALSVLALIVALLWTEGCHHNGGLIISCLAQKPTHLLHCSCARTLMCRRTLLETGACPSFGHSCNLPGAPHRSNRGLSSRRRVYRRSLTRTGTSIFGSIHHWISFDPYRSSALDLFWASEIRLCRSWYSFYCAYLHILAP